MYAIQHHKNLGDFYGNPYLIYIAVQLQCIVSTYIKKPIQDFSKTFSIKVAWSLQFLGYLRTKIEVFLSLPFWLSQMLVLAIWSFKVKVLKYQWNFRPNATLISKFGETPNLHTTYVLRIKSSQAWKYCNIPCFP